MGVMTHLQACVSIPVQCRLIQGLQLGEGAWVCGRGPAVAVLGFPEDTTPAGDCANVPLRRPLFRFQKGCNHPCQLNAKCTTWSVGDRLAPRGPSLKRPGWATKIHDLQELPGAT